MYHYYEHMSLLPNRIDYLKEFAGFFFVSIMIMGFFISTKDLWGLLGAAIILGVAFTGTYFRQQQEIEARRQLAFYLLLESEKNFKSDKERKDFGYDYYISMQFANSVVADRFNEDLNEARRAMHTYRSMNDSK